MKTLEVEDFLDVPEDYTGIVERKLDGLKLWLKNGNPHREDGPAVVHMMNEYAEYWLNGQQVTEKEFWVKPEPKPKTEGEETMGYEEEIEEDEDVEENEEEEDMEEETEPNPVRKFIKFVAEEVLVEELHFGVLIAMPFTTIIAVLLCNLFFYMWSGFNFSVVHLCGHLMATFILVPLTLAFLIPLFLVIVLIVDKNTKIDWNT